VSVCEIIKREYRKMFLSADALKLAQEAAVAENAGLANPSLKLPPKSGHKLFQYNRLSVHSPTAALDTPVASTSARAAEGMDEDEAEVEVPDAQAAKAHDKALEEIVDKGRKRPRKKHVPKMEVVLSCRKLDWLHSTDGWSCVSLFRLAATIADSSLVSIQSPDAPMGGPVKKSTLRARAHKKQKATRRKEAKRRTGAQTGPAPVPASTAAPASTQATSVA
jgi:hypothetical protein